MNFKEIVESLAGRWDDSVPQTLEKIREKAKERYGDKAPDLTEEHLTQRYNNGFPQANGFLQCLPNGNYSPHMLLMAYRIAQGWFIKSMMLYHVSRNKFSLAVTIYEPHEPEVHDYFETESVFDFGLLKHILSYNVGDEPVLDGFYPLRLRSNEPKK